MLQQLDGNIIGPKILGDFIGISPLWVIVSITVMGGLLGVYGMFLGVPTFAVIYAFIKEITEKSLEKKGYPTDTDAYYSDPDYRIITHVPADAAPPQKKHLSLKLRAKEKPSADTAASDTTEDSGKSE